MEKEVDKKNLKITIIEVIGAILIVVAVILAIWFFLNGEKTVTGGYPDSEKTTALTCQKQDMTYPVVDSKDEGTTVKDLEIDAVFNGQELNSIALAYTLHYSGAEAVTIGEAKFHAAMNKAFSTDELSPDSFNANYNKLQTSLKMTLYATRAELNEKSARYFLVDFTKKNPLTLDVMKKSYEEREFICRVNDK